MIHPSYSELIDAINDNAEDNDNTMLVNSRYSLVLATSKRARQLIGGSRPLVKDAEGKKPLSIAIEELYKGKVKILEKVEEEEEQQTAAAGEESAALADSSAGESEVEIAPEEAEASADPAEEQ
ncbi:MAG: DNA-directed RNA polymerase subunit omega [Blautia sp.]|nr:DNA-directed RNA polymerase subunit omega [Blautia sp.]